MLTRFWCGRNKAAADTRWVKLGRRLLRSGGTVLAAGEVEVFRRISRAAFPGIEKEGLLPDVDPRTPARTGATGTKGGGMDEGVGVSQAGQKGGAAL